MAQAWQTGRMVTYPRTQTIADGIAVRVPIPDVVADMQGTVDDVVQVHDESLVQGMQLVHEPLGLVVEPSGVVGVATLLEQRARFAGRRVATVFCGGNLTPEQIGQWLR